MAIVEIEPSRDLEASASTFSAFDPQHPKWDALAKAISAANSPDAILTISKEGLPNLTFSLHEIRQIGLEEKQKKVIATMSRAISEADTVVITNGTPKNNFPFGSNN